MAEWRIYYEGGTFVKGLAKADWLAAPDTGLQVVVLMEAPASDERRWFYTVLSKSITVEDRKLWTGQDTYDPFGWGEKQGSLIDTVEYFKIWDAACGDN